MTLRLVLFSAFIFLLSVVFVLGATAKFVFTTEPQTINPSDLSSVLTIQSQDSSGEKVNTTETIDLEFSSTSSSGEFLNSSGNPASTVMSKGTANRAFYYRDPAFGVFALSVKAIGRESGQSWTATQNITVGSEPQSIPSSSEDSSGSESSGSVSPISNPQVVVDAGPDKVVVAGAAAKYDGMALGLKGEPITNADFIWSFGDGSAKRGQTVYYAYNYPGKYSADLNVSFGGTSVLDRAVITVIPNSVSVSEVKPGESGWVELFNDSNWTLDLSRWGVSNGGFAFYLPQNSTILPKSYVVISYASSKVSFPAQIGQAAILYPNAAPASNFDYSGSLLEDESFHNVLGEVKIGVSSPGEERVVVRHSAQSFSAPALANSGQNQIGQSPALTNNQEASAGENADYNLALAKEVLPEEGGFSDKPVFWFLSALGLGVVSAGSYLVIKRKGFF